MNRPDWMGSRLLVLALYCGLIFTLSAMSTVPTPPLGIEWGDKVVHGCAYALMMLLAFRAARLRPEHRLLLTQLGIAWLFTALYGVSDEYHQSFVPGRTSEFADWVADASGAALAGLFIYLTIDRSIGRRFFSAIRSSGAR